MDLSRTERRSVHPVQSLDLTAIRTAKPHLSTPELLGLSFSSIWCSCSACFRFRLSRSGRFVRPTAADSRSLRQPIRGGSLRTKAVYDKVSENCQTHRGCRRLCRVVGPECSSFFSPVRRQNSICPKLHLLLTVRGTNSELKFGVNGGVSGRVRTRRRSRILKSSQQDT